VKRFLPLLAVAALVAVPAASAGKAAPPTLQSGKLIVAFGDPAPGFASGTTRGNTITNPRGYEVDLAKAIASKLGLTPAWMFSPWNSLFAPGTKKFDISFQEATITSQRKRTVDFTTSYLNANQGVLTSKQATAPTSLADLKQLQTCAQTNTTGLDWIQHKLRPSKAPRVYSASSSAAFDAVQSGACQALILDVPIIEAQNAKQPDAYGGVVGEIDTNEGYGAVFAKDSPLIPAVSKAIKTLESNGTIAKLTKQWFGYDPSKIPVLQ